MDIFLKFRNYLKKKTYQSKLLRLKNGATTLLWKLTLFELHWRVSSVTS